MGIVFSIFKWLFILLVLFSLLSALLYYSATPKRNKNWTIEHAILPVIEITGNTINPDISVKNIRDFRWALEDKAHYQNMQFKLKDVVELKAGVSHFAPLNNIAHVFMTFVLVDGRELGISVEARREQGEQFSLQGGLLAKFELIYVVATPEDLLSIRKINKEKTRIYPIKETKEKAQELFLLIANSVNEINQKPQIYHLFFKNCTNQLVRHVSILTERKYPLLFQTIAPGNTAKMLYEFDLIDMPGLSFEEIQERTLIK